ncbi:ankyrin repeat-containing domain protein [Thelonectria olida]|uniref:Ankyrin repeat-containing domain protein n=1 Tax=Thelonectria olida TaxID=1576542 RepID=A0A9P9AL87_9HYPO|nr:ankyrin repeat-containing domain protein [Thelonectria olida]
MMGKTPFIESLLKRPETTIDVVDSSGVTFLHLAVRKEVYLELWKVPLVDFLLQHPEIGAAAADSQGRTVLHDTIEEGPLAIIQSLLSRPEVNAGSPNLQGSIPLHLAVEDERLDVVEFLLQRHTVDATSVDEHGHTVLRYTVKADRGDDATISLIQRLLGMGIRINAASIYGPVLVRAIKRCNCRAALTLLDNGANLLSYSKLDAPEAGKSPLEWACDAGLNSGQYELLKFVLSKSTRVNISHRYLERKISESVDMECTMFVTDELLAFRRREFLTDALSYSEEEMTEEEDESEDGSLEEGGNDQEG